jgi:signal transduction histidine kinase
MTDHGFASIVRSLAEGVDPGRVLRVVAEEALARTATSHLLLTAMLEGQMTPLVAIGSAQGVLLEAAGEAFSSGQAARRSDPGAGLAVLAVPVRHRGTVIAALAVAGGRAGTAELEGLALAADCAALALAARPAPGLLAGARDTGTAGLLLTEGLSALATARTIDEVLARALDLAATAFGARAGFVCLPTGPGDLEVTAWRGLDRDRLGPASRHPGFARLVSGDGVAVVPPTDPVVGQLSAGAEFAVSLPLVDGGPGALVLLVAEEPDVAGRRALAALRLSVAAALEAARSAATAKVADGRLSALVHLLPDPVVVVDGRGCFTTLNAAAAELFALSDSFEIGRPARGRLGHPGLEAMLLGAPPSAGDADRSGTGPPGPAATTVEEVVLGRPTPRRYQATARSLGVGGDRVLVLRAAGSAPASQEGFDVVAALGRALRDPLAAIAALVAPRLAGDGVAPSSDWEVARRAIMAEAARLEAMADQLSLLSADGRDAAAAVVAVRPERTDVVAAVGLMVSTRRSAHPGRDLTLSAPVRLDASVDRRLLERVVDPLIDNALRYSDGPVTVEIADRGDTFEIAVLDGGPGIFSGDIPALFERFHPLDGSPARPTGVSLYTGRRLAELMGGRLWCDSRLGVGSRFALRLPQSPVLR